MVRGRSFLIFAIVLVMAVSTLAQLRRGGRGGGRRSSVDRSAYPNWENPDAFKQDVFTFARVQYDTYYGGRGSNWKNDHPDCDWNFSVRLKELTSFEVDPDGIVVRLTDPEIFDYPFLYMSNVGGMSLRPDEAAAMRKYLLNGGFIMADDFWTPAEWRSVKQEMKQVFPDREPRELGIEHEIFNLVYKIDAIPQIPSIFAWQDGLMYEPWHNYGNYEGDYAPHFYGYFDDHGRLVALMCLNNDIGDGWEREGENKEFFEKFSIKVSYPLGINIVTYAMTH